MSSLLLLVGGKGTRLGNLTKKTPKCLIKIHNKPFLYYLLKQFEENDIKNVYLCSKYKSKEINKFIADYKSSKLEIKIVNDGKDFLGTGGTIKKLIKSLDNDFFVQNGDTFLNVNYNYLYTTNKKFNKSLICYSNFKYNTLDIPNLLTEKDKIFNYNKNNFKNNNSIDAGLYIFKKDDFNDISKKKFDLSLLINKLISRKKLRGYQIKRKFYEIGSFKGLADFRKYIKRISQYY